MARLNPGTVLAAALMLAVALAAPAIAGPDLSGFVPVLDEEFDAPLNRFDGTTGLWKDHPRNDRFIGNGPPSFYANAFLQRPGGGALGLDPFAQAGGQLSIRAAAIPAAALADARAILAAAGYRAEEVAGVSYYTGMISTRSSWAQTYGHFEMRARMPEGAGHWPAFWLTPAVAGWPPEIDIVEVLGRQNGTAGGADNTIHLRVHFDEIAADGSAAPEPLLANPFDLAEGSPRPAIRRAGPAGPRYTFARSVDAGALGRDIFDDFNVYALSWTPAEITWWFGPSADALQPIYRSPTPRDANGPMSVIINDQIGGDWAGAPVAAAMGSALVIDRVRLMALAPAAVLAGDLPVLEGTAGGERIAGGPADQTILAGGGFDILTGGGGRDRFVIPAGAGSKILTDFGADDVLVLNRWSFDAPRAALDHLTQVGADAWLIDNRPPEAVQTLILQGMDAQGLGPANFEFTGQGL